MWMNLMLILYSRFFKYLLKIYIIIKIYNWDRNKSKFGKSLYVDNVLIWRDSIANKSLHKSFNINFITQTTKF